MPDQEGLLQKKFAWNGISLRVPMSWEVDSLDKDHVIIGEDTQPRMEIKWTDSPGKFTLEKYLKNFISQTQKKLKIKIYERSTPGSFKQTNQDFEFFFFSWKGASSSGRGSLIFCSHCKKLSLIRFFSKSNTLPGSLQESILLSYEDHSNDDHIYWRVFGLHFSTPHRFSMTDYSFKPGCYILTFSHKKTRLTVYSWGPASFLLSKTSITEFATQRLSQLEGFAESGVCKCGDCFQWKYRYGILKNIHTLPILNRYSRYTVFRICREKTGNRIIGVMVDSQKKFEHDLIKESVIGDIEKKKQL